MPPSSRSRIVEAVLQLVQHERRADFTFDEVAKAAGVSRQTVHANFANRGELLVAVVELARERAGGPQLAQAIYQAGTGAEALEALLDFHVAFTPAIMRPALVVDAERLRSPELQKHFETRPEGRHQIVRHVMTRLSAEGLLDPAWSVDSAADLVTALLSPGTTAELMEHRHWTVDVLRAHLRQTLRAITLPTSDETDDPNQGAPR